jgi:hypothetical protein
VCAQFSAQQLSLGVVGWPVVRKLVQPVAFLAIGVHLYRAIRSTVSILPKVIQAEVGDNAVDPRREGALEPEAA